MYEAHYGLSEKPFRKTPDPRYLFLNEIYEEALERLLFAVEEMELALLTGEVGSGKTLLDPRARRPAGRRVRGRDDPEPPPRPAAVPPHGGAGARGRGAALPRERPPRPDPRRGCSSWTRQGRAALLIVDEAHLIPGKPTFEEIRLLTNFQLDDRNLIAIVLVGQPELRERLEHRAYRALTQRIGAQFHLTPLSAEDTRRLPVRHRLSVAGATRAVFERAARFAVCTRPRAGVPAGAEPARDPGAPRGHGAGSGARWTSDRRASAAVGTSCDAGPADGRGGAIDRWDAWPTPGSGRGGRRRAPRPPAEPPPTPGGRGPARARVRADPDGRAVRVAAGASPADGAGGAPCAARPRASSCPLPDWPRTSWPARKPRQRRAGGSAPGPRGPGARCVPGREAPAAAHSLSFFSAPGPRGADGGRGRRSTSPPSSSTARSTGSTCGSCRRSAGSPRSPQVPRAPDFIKGVINLRGRIIPVVDLKKKLGLGEVEIRSASRIVVVQLKERLLGLLVDGASQVLKVPVSRIEPRPRRGRGEGRRLPSAAWPSSRSRLIILRGPARSWRSSSARSCEPRMSPTSEPTTHGAGRAARRWALLPVVGADLGGRRGGRAQEQRRRRLAARPSTRSQARSSRPHRHRVRPSRATAAEAERVLGALKGKAGASSWPSGPWPPQVGARDLPDAPLVFCMVQDPAKARPPERPNVSGVAFSIPDQEPARRLPPGLPARQCASGSSMSSDERGHARPGGAEGRRRGARRLVVTARVALRARTCPRPCARCSRATRRSTRSGCPPDPMLLGDETRRFILAETLKAGKPVLQLLARPGGGRRPRQQRARPRLDRRAGRPSW